MRSMGLLLWGLWLLGLSASVDEVARVRFERALTVHGGDAYKQLLENGYKADYEITREHGGKSTGKRTEYRQGERLFLKVKRGAFEEQLAYDGNSGWRKSGYLVSGIATEEVNSLRDGTLTHFTAIPRWLARATLVGGEPAKLPDGRPAYRITFQLPPQEHQQSLPKKPEGTLACYLNDNDQIIALEYQSVNYETDEITRVVHSYFNYRPMKTPAGEVLMPIETRVYAGGTHTATYFLTALDAQSPPEDKLFSRPPSDPSPAVRETLPATVPFRMRRLSLYVEITINGKGPYWIILDTGASSTWIDASVAKEAGLEKIPDSDHYGVMVYGAFPSYKAKAKSIKIGNAEVRDMVISVGDLRYTPLADDQLDGKRAIGLLGREVLSAFQLTIDFAKRTLILEPPDAELPQGTVVPFEMYGDHILVTTGIGPRNQVRMIVDTGAAMNLLPPSYQPEKEDGVWMTLAEWSKRFGEAHEDDPYGFMTGDMRVYRLHQVTMGDLRFESVYAIQRLSEGVRADSILASKTKHGLLGMPVMRHYRLTFNYYRQQMVWQPHSESERASENAGYGIWWKQNGKDLVVQWVMPLSDADLQGVRKGDKILLIDGQSPVGWSEKQLVARLSYTRPGRPLQLVVERAGKRLEFQLTARNYEL